MRDGTSYIPESSKDDPKFNNGNKAVLKFSRMINTIGGIEFSEFQLDILVRVFPYIIPIFFHKHWASKKSAIMELYEIKEIEISGRKIICISSRRAGKTTFNIALFICIMICAPFDDDKFHLRLSVPAQCLEVSRKILKLLVRRFKSTPDFENGYVKLDIENADTFKIHKNGSGSAQVSAFSRKVRKHTHFLVG